MLLMSANYRPWSGTACQKRRWIISLGTMTETSNTLWLRFIKYDVSTLYKSPGQTGNCFKNKIDLMDATEMTLNYLKMYWISIVPCFLQQKRTANRKIWLSQTPTSSTLLTWQWRMYFHYSYCRLWISSLPRQKRQRTWHSSLIHKLLANRGLIRDTHETFDRFVPLFLKI